MMRTMIQIKSLLVGTLLVFGIVSTSVDAAAFCISNQAKTSLHGQSLDSQNFQADIPPGKQACCATCVNPKRRDWTNLLIVSGYVPVTQESQPGWQAECRIKTPATGHVVVTGDISQISCKVQPGE